MKLIPDRTSSGLAVLRLEGACACRNGWAFVRRGEYDYAEACRDCGSMRDLAGRFNAASLPAWAHEVAAGWSDDIAPRSAAVDLARRLKESREFGRTYFGDTGRGKSWRACAVATAWLDAGGSLTWVTWPAFVNELRNRIAEKLGGIADSVARPLQSPLLIIDELGCGQDTPFAREVAERIVGQRAEMGAPMLVTTNKNPDALRDYIGDRAWSRLARYRVTEVAGVDLRAKEDA